MTVEGDCLCCFGFVGVFFWWCFTFVKKPNPTQSINAVTQPSTVKAQLMEQLNFTLGDRIFKCDFSQKKQHTKLYQTLLRWLGSSVLLHCGPEFEAGSHWQGLGQSSGTEEPPGCPHEPPACPVTQRGLSALVSLGLLSDSQIIKNS